MPLQSKHPATHNQMLGNRIRHPASTNFDEEDFKTPTAKRLKRLDSTDSSLSRKGESEDEEDCHENGLRYKTPPKASREIPDSEAESDDDDDFQAESVRKTDLESALPPVKTDKEAIAEYEATRAAEAQDLGLTEDESHLFDEAEMAVFEQWRDLSYEGQYLYVRLFLRKTAAWHRINRLGYYGDIADLPAAAKDLLNLRGLPAVVAPTQVNPGEAEPPQDTVLGDAFTFADSSENHIDSLEAASSLLKLDELKALAKEAKVQGKNKSELLKALRKTSQAQGGISWGSLKRSDTEDSIKSERGTKADEELLDGKEEYDGRNVNRDSHFVRKILASTGPCIRLSTPTLKLFERVHLVFYRSTEWTEKSLTTIILARISRRNFPDYIVSRSTNIFANRSDLLEFEASIRTQFRIDFILEFNGTVRKDGLQTVKDVFEDVYPRWKIILKEEQRKEDRVYESGEGAYLRRFSPAWVYTRIVHKGTYVLGRFKEHEREHQMLTELLDQHLFHAARRGAWYQRKALLEEHYMWALKPSDGRSEDMQKKHWKKLALQTCEDGLQDRECHLIYHYDLQKRVMKLEKSLKVVKREQHDFGHVLLAKPAERTVEGIRIERERTPSRNRNQTESEIAAPRRGGKTVWVDEREGGGECSVEAMCLSWYRDQGWKGYHSEGGIVRTLFGYLFYDVLFTYIPNVFQTPYQTCPLDLHTDAFYPSRTSTINHRLVEIANGDASRLLQEVYDREHERQTCIVGIHWDYDIDDLQEIVKCFKGEALATVCKVMAQEYQQRGGGIPDLFLWHPENGEVMFSEVKSENDRLSDTQRLWIHVLTGAGIKVELCNAVTKEVKTLR
ncbi:fanconi-associated nuclease 1, partial [Lecanoromycetidae sp. Uapishka_2]